MKKRIKSYLHYGEKCGIAKQVEGKIVEAYKDVTKRNEKLKEELIWVMKN